LSTSRNRVYGPLVSSATPDAHEHLFVEVFGMEVVGRHEITDEDVLDTLAPDSGLVGISVLVLRTPGTDSGVVVLGCDPASGETVRSWETRVDRDALKVIDFYAPDFAAAVAHARSLGYEVEEAEASYELPQGSFTEAHLWGPDNVVTALLGGPAEFFADFAQVGDRLVSEVQSISAPLTSADDSVRFYRDVLEWDVVFEYALDDPSFAQMLGVDELTLRSRNVGPSTREPYFGLIDYGLGPAHEGSLRGRSALPRRGLVGAVVLSDDLDRVVAAAGREATPLTPLSLRLPALRSERALWLHTPHTVPHLVLDVSPDLGAHPRAEEGNPPC
jgi:catechol 2,3-dioxygenase-like lactoylglutathione lyase family enzyme